MIKNAITVSALACGCITAAAMSAQAADTSDWQRVGTGITGGVSGMALVVGSPVGSERADVVVVRDNKKDGQPRVSAVSLRAGRQPIVKDLKWQDPKGRALPKDLEALDAVPGQKDHYIALASEGTAYHIRIKGDTATVLGDPASLPGVQPYDNYESFATHRAPDGQTLAVWATRGKNAQKSVIRVAPLTVTAARLAIGTPTDTAQFAVPFPDTDEVRHMSDLKVLPDGTLLVSAASDPNDDNGPFASAVYNAGELDTDRPSHPSLNLKKSDELTLIRKFTQHDDRKIEAVVQLPGGQQLWGTDDENHGGSVKFAKAT